MVNNMLETFKAKIRKWSDITSEDLLKLLRWGGSPIDNPKALVCAASCNGEMLGYMTAEPMLLIHSYALNPETTPSDLQKAGDAIDRALEVESQRVGACRMLILLPSGAPRQSDEIVLRVIERKIQQPGEKQHGDEISERVPMSTWIN
jgi:hypothetical protein